MGVSGLTLNSSIRVKGVANPWFKDGLGIKNVGYHHLGGLRVKRDVNLIKLVSYGVNLH